MTGHVTITKDQLLDIWLAGYSSGVASAVTNLAQGSVHAAVAEPAAYSIANAATRTVSNDPAARETIRDAIDAQLRGQPQPPQSLRVFGATL